MFDRRIILSIIALFCFFGIGACSKTIDPTTSDPSEDQRAAAVEEIREAIETYYNAFYESNWELYYSYYADDVVLIDSSGNPMSLDEYNGTAEERAQLIGQVVIESVKDLVPEVRLSADGGSAIAHYRHPFDYRKPDGTESTIDWAETDIWWKINGNWKVVHVHFHEIASKD